jgi:hypothetical protein
MIVKRIEVAQRELHVARLVPLSDVAVAKAHQPDHVENERHTDKPCHGGSGGPQPREPLRCYVRTGVGCDFAHRARAPSKLLGLAGYPPPTIGTAEGGYK